MKTFNLCLWHINMSRQMILFFTIVFVIIISGSLFAESTTSIPDIKVVDEFLQNTVASYKVPGLAIAFVSDNEIIYTSGYGEASPGVEVEPNTPFLLGSTTKMFTALGVMRLVEQGKVELDSPVKRYLPEFSLAIPESEDHITVRHLLNHTSGLSDKGMPGTTMGEESLEKELISLRQCIPDSAPGERYVYFNVNYRLLGLIIERVSGMKYGEFLSKEIFRPLSMTSTFAGPEGVKELAVGHGQFFGFPVQGKQIFRPGAVSSGYLVSNTSDIARFLIAELKAGSGKSGILNPETVKSTWIPPGGANDGYAMGWLVANDSVNEQVLIHGGAIEKYQSFFYINPQRNIGFVFLMNQGGLLPMLSFNTIRNGLLKIINGEQPETGSVRWPIIVVSGIFLFFLGIEIFRTIRLRTWILRTPQKKLWRRWLNIFIELIWSCFLLFGFTPLMNTLMGHKADWTMIYGFIPELFYLLVISICLGFFRGFFKIWSLKRNLQSAAW